MSSIIPITEFAELLKVDREAALRIMRLNKLKKKLKGIREPYVDLNKWEDRKRKAS